MGVRAEGRGAKNLLHPRSTRVRGHRAGGGEGAAGTRLVDFFLHPGNSQAEKVPTRVPDIPLAGQLQDLDWNREAESEGGSV